MKSAERRQILDGALAALFLMCPGLLIPGAVNPGPDTGERIICGGVVIAEKALLRSEPDSSSAVVGELPFGTPFLTLGDSEEVIRFKREEGYGRKAPPWFHVLLFDSMTSGWITCREARESPWWYAGLEQDDFVRLRYRVGLRSVQEKDCETADRLLSKVLENHPDAEIPYYDGWGWSWGNARTGALIGLAMMYRSIKQYKKAIEHYEMIASDTSDSAEARAKARLMIVRIYCHDLRDYDLGLQAVYGVAADFPGQPIRGPEHYGIADAEAAEYALLAFREDGPGADQLIHYGAKMIDITSDPTVKMIGHILLCEGYRRQKQYERIKQTMMDALLKWPTARGAGFKDMRNDYSREALELVVESLTEDLNDYDQALEFCAQLLSRTDHPALHKNLVCARARLLDVLQTSKEAVVSAYQECNHWRVRKRLSTILSFQEYEAIISVGQVAVKSRPARQAKDLFILSKGNRVTVLYEDPKRYDQEDWLKIQANGDRIGWVERSTFTPE